MNVLLPNSFVARRRGWRLDRLDRGRAGRLRARRSRRAGGRDVDQSTHDLRRVQGLVQTRTARRHRRARALDQSRGADLDARR